MVKHKQSRSVFRRVAATAALLCGFMSIALAGHGSIHPAPVAAAITECRPLSTLDIKDVFRSAIARRVGSGPWRITLTLNTSRHTMLCDTDFYCPGNIDKIAFRPPLSSNIASASVVTGSQPFPNCQLIWDLMPSSNSADIGFGIKAKYQEDVVGHGGSGINPKRLTATLTIHQASYVDGTDLDVTDSLVNAADDGSES
jgi:hypothetical protein